MIQPSFDLQPPGATARDAALAKVESNNEEWFRLALIELEEIAKHGARHWANMETFIGEDLKRMLVPSVGHPASPNTWGALVMAAVRKGWIENTGQLRAMQNTKSHARRSMVYRWAQ